MKNTIITIIVLVLVALGVYVAFKQLASPSETSTPTDTGIATSTTTSATTTPSGTATSTPHVVKLQEVIGQSAGGRDITAHYYGTGTTKLLFVGGIHGGYEWNTTLVAYKLMDYLTAHPEEIPTNEQITVIPVANPDGLEKTVGTTDRFTVADVPTPESATISGRFNDNNVDINRNFDCDWSATGTWQNTPVSGGTAAFSEPEARAIRDYVNAHTPSAVVVWYSAAGGVYSSSCHNGISEETSAITNLYAQASQYPAYEDFDYYKITGDMVNWLAKENIPAISVLLTNHTDTEWSKNLAGIKALLTHYAQ